MISLKTIGAVLLLIGAMLLSTFQVYSISKTNEDKFDQRINSLDSRIDLLKSEICNCTIHKTNKSTQDNN